MKGQPKVLWTEEQLAELIRRYPHERTEDLARDLGRPANALYNKAGILGLKKSADYLAGPAACRLRRGDQIGKRFQFKKGHVPFNKGLTGVTYPGCVATQFKKGSRNGRAEQLYQPIGTERISKDGYLERKIHDDMPLQRRWRGVHLLLWEGVNGPLPKGHALTFKDGNKAHIALDNLELVTRGELMKRNSYHNYPKDIALLVQLRGALVRKINNRAKREQQEQTA